MDAMPSPSGDDRYDPYDPRHPMWADRFWAEYCTRNLTPSTRPTAPAGPAQSG